MTELIGPTAERLNAADVGNAINLSQWRRQQTDNGQRTISCRRRFHAECNDVINYYRGACDPALRPSSSESYRAAIAFKFKKMLDDAGLNRFKPVWHGLGLQSEID